MGAYGEYYRELAREKEQADQAHHLLERLVEAVERENREFCVTKSDAVRWASKCDLPNDALNTDIVQTLTKPFSLNVDAALADARKYLEGGAVSEQIFYPEGIALVQCCPVCHGRGIVSRGFYRVPADQPTFTDSSTGPETCRQCKGGGLLYGHTGEPAQPTQARR